MQMQGEQLMKRLVRLLDIGALRFAGDELALASWRHAASPSRIFSLDDRSRLCRKTIQFFPLSSPQHRVCPTTSLTRFWILHPLGLGHQSLLPKQPYPKSVNHYALLTTVCARQWQPIVLSTTNVRKEVRWYHDITIHHRYRFNDPWLIAIQSGAHSAERAYFEF